MATCLILSCPLHQTSQRLTALVTLLPTLTGNWLFSETHQENPLNSTPNKQGPWSGWGGGGEGELMFPRGKRPCRRDKHRELEQKCLDSVLLYNGYPPV